MQEAVEEAGRDTPTDFDEKRIKREFLMIIELGLRKVTAARDLARDPALAC